MNRDAHQNLLAAEMTEAQLHEVSGQTDVEVSKQDQLDRFTAYAMNALDALVLDMTPLG
jgi:hypothetical protein